MLFYWLRDFLCFAWRITGALRMHCINNWVRWSGKSEESNRKAGREQRDFLVRFDPTGQPFCRWFWTPYIHVVRHGMQGSLCNQTHSWTGGVPISLDGQLPVCPSRGISHRIATLHIAVRIPVILFSREQISVQIALFSAFALQYLPFISNEFE